MNENMSNMELLSTITGQAEAQALLAKFGSLSELKRVPPEELARVPGVGPRKAAAVQSALALACRMSRESHGVAPVLDTPESVADLLREEYRACTVETITVVLLNTRRRLIRADKVSQGTLDTLLITPREVFAPAITARAAAVVLAHAHPSGDPTPSEADIKVTRDLVRAGQILKIEVLDHVILGQRTTERPRDFVSLRELGYIF